MKTPLCGLILFVILSSSMVGISVADNVRYTSSPTSYPQVRNGLVQEFGVATFPPLAETLQTNFTVPGSGAVDLNFRFKYDVGVLLFSFGYYRVTPELSAINLSTDAGKREYATKALAPDNATLIFDDAFDNPGATYSVTADGGDVLGFFLLPDAALDEFQFFPSRFGLRGTGSATYNVPPPLRWPFFSVPDANPGAFDQLMSFSGVSRVTSRTTNLFAWEDLTRLSIPGNFLPSDNQFNDLIFAVDSSPAIPDPPFNVRIANPSFEADVLPDGFWIDDHLTGWNVFGFTAGPQNWTDAQYPGANDADAIPSTVPDGLNSAFIRSPLAGIEQTVAATLQPNTEYRLEFFVGDRFDTIMPNWKAELFAGGTKLAENDTGVRPGNGEWLLASLVYTTGPTNAALGELLTIRFSTYGFTDPPGSPGLYQVGIDKVRLTATPIPEPSSLFVASLSAIAVFRRREKHEAQPFHN